MRLRLGWRSGDAERRDPGVVRRVFWGWLFGGIRTGITLRERGRGHGERVRATQSVAERRDPGVVRRAVWGRCFLMNYLGKGQGMTRAEPSAKPRNNARAFLPRVRVR